MKKFITILSTIALMMSLTACSDEKNTEFNQEVADTTVAMLDEYYEGMRYADFDLAFKNYPDFYVNNVELEINYYGVTKDEYLSANNETWYNENYGEDATISVGVVSTTLMTKSVTRKYNKLVTNLYKGEADIESVYTVVVDKTVSGDIKTDTTQETWTILEIDNRYWLYDDYFEKLAQAQNSVDSSNQVTVVVS